MDEEFLPVPGIPIASDDLTIPRARDAALLLKGENFPFARLLECRRATGDRAAEVVVVEVEVQRGQEVVHDIRPRERIALIFTAADDHYPEVLALRPDFPLVPHVNLRRDEHPRSLCLFDRPWAEVRLALTAARLIDGIREWLRLTARGELHAGDQPLEPLLAPWIPPIVLPFDPRDPGVGERPEPLTARLVGTSSARYMLRADLAGGAADGSALDFVATIVRSGPQAHGVIGRQPETLAALHDMLAASGCDLLEELRTRLGRWQARRILAARLIVIVLLPKTRVPGGTVEEVEPWAFLFLETVEAIGRQLGVFDPRSRGRIPRPLAIPDRAQRGDRLRIEPLKPIMAFTRQQAARLAGRGEADVPAVVAFGLGALGSQVAANLSRMGWGEWTLVDEDCLLPHNLARHELDSADIGQPKAEALARRLNRMLHGADVAQPIVADVLSPRAEGADLAAALSRAAILLDLTASVPVARHLALQVDAPGRRVSLYLNPEGTDLVLLAEDAEREAPLDVLEMQYYRLLIRTPSLAGHLNSGDQAVRYARSCQDVSTTIPQDRVALHAAIASRALLQATAKTGASIAIWRADPDTLTVEKVESEASAIVEQQAGSWTIRTDRGLLKSLARAREARLPNETGGVLIGAFDVPRRIAYIVDALPSPPDSVEEPTGYVRGHEGLRAQLEHVGAVTGGMVQYAGEWHAHPQAASTHPSRADGQLLGWLREQLRSDGLPALMLIVGEGGATNWLLAPADGMV